MVNNCLAYNRKDTMFYRAGIKMKEQGGILIEQARKDYPELDPGENEQTVSKSRKRDRNNRSRGEIELQSGEKEIGGGGVNRRTAVLFTRKARARASRSNQMFTLEDDKKKQSDSFKIYRYVLFIYLFIFIIDNRISNKDSNMYNNVKLISIEVEPWIVMWEKVKVNHRVVAVVQQVGPLLLI